MLRVGFQVVFIDKIVHLVGVQGRRRRISAVQSLFQRGEHGSAFLHEPRKVMIDLQEKYNSLCQVELQVGRRRGRQVILQRNAEQQHDEHGARAELGHHSVGWCIQ